MATVRLCALGSLRLIVDQTSCAITASAPALLLGYMICHAAGGQPIARSRLAGTLWPDVTEARARRNLTDALYRLRRTLGLENADQVLRVDNETIALGEIVVDVHEFRRLSTSPDPTHWPAALEIYTADLLADLDAEWLLAPREQLHTLYLSTLERVCQMYNTTGQLDSALNAAHRWVQADPLSEHAHVTAMRLSARLGRPAAALQQYDRLVQRLDRDLGVAPLPETRALAEVIRGELQVSRHVPSPVSTLPFVGRVAARSQALEAVEAAMAGQGGVLAIEGEAGLGKSRLLREIAAGADWRGVAVAIGQVTDYPAASPLASLSDVLSALLSGARTAQIETLLSAETLAALAPINARWQAQATLPELPPLPARQRFHQALVDLLKTLADLAPHVIMIDDVQYATAAWWEALEAVVPVLMSCRVLMILTYRRSLIEQTAGWAIVQRWERAGQLKAMVLSALTRAEIAQLLPPGTGDSVEIQVLHRG